MSSNSNSEGGASWLRSLSGSAGAPDAQQKALREMRSIDLDNAEEGDEESKTASSASCFPVAEQSEEEEEAMNREMEKFHTSIKLLYIGAATFMSIAAIISLLGQTGEKN
jgi:hypothetical protein